MPKIQTKSFAKLPNNYATIERNRGLNLLEERLIYMLINDMQYRYESVKNTSNIDFDFIATGNMSFDNFRKTMQIKSKDNSLIISALKDIFNFTLYIHTQDIMSMVHIFEYISIDEKTLTIYYKFNNYFLKYFTGICGNYFQLTVNEVVGLDSTHALRIYQILKTKQNMNQKVFTFTIEELKLLLNLNGKYDRYSNLKIKVLDIAKQRINSSEASQFNIQYTELKTGKKVHSIVFEILPKVKNYYIETGKTPEYAKDLLANQLRALINHEDFNVKKAVSTILDELKKKKPNKPLVNAYLTTVNAIEKTNYKL